MKRSQFRSKRTWLAYLKRLADEALQRRRDQAQRRKPAVTRARRP